MTEAQIRKELGIPNNAERVIIFSQSSHMDWDWLETFPVLFDDPSAPYFQGAGNLSVPAKEILSQAAAQLATSMPPGAPPNYYYSLAEVGFLEAFFAHGTPSDVQTLVQAAKDGLFHLVGGGITSPDSLLSQGECFIRNSLVAQAWFEKNLPGATVENFWIPDDFGHDSQLPATLEAMGLKGAAFERIPGGEFQQPPANPLNGQPSAATQLINEGIDFFWYADDGSRIMGHYLIKGYCQVSTDIGGNFGIQEDIDNNLPSSPTPYVFVPAGCDFNPPVPNLVKSMQAWNNAPASQPGYARSGVYAVSATFDHYVSLVEAHAGNLRNRRFAGIPMWVGNYGSKPALKRWQYEASRAATAAEVFGVIGDVLKAPVAPDWTTSVFDAWHLAVPSTHHDYVVGTSGAQYMDVYGVEQLSRLLLAKDQAGLVEEANMLALTRAITPNLTSDRANNYETPVAVFNPLGFERSGLVEYPDGADQGAINVRNSLSKSGLVQPTHDGALLFMASAPSLGYSTSYMNGPSGGGFPSTSSALSITTPDNGASWVLANDLISVTVAQSANWGITSIKDLKNNDQELLYPGSVGNDLAFYTDTGSVYRYGNETPPGTSMVLDTTACLAVAGALVTETGPLRVTLETMVNATVTNQTFSYKRTYSLVLGEPMIRMSCSGVAPSSDANFSGTSVMTRFVLPFAVNRMSYGTPNHWTSMPPVQSWDGPQFLPTHNFAIPLRQDGTQALAIYHNSMPPWGYDDNGALLGNLFRNNPYQGQGQYGAQSPDRGMHTQFYALRVPTGLCGPDTGQPLRESLAFKSPLKGRVVSNLSTQTAPETFSLASINGPSPAIITAAKPSWKAGSGDTIFRIHQPTNTSQTVSMTVGTAGSAPTGATGVTALENPLSAEASGRLHLSVNQNTVTFYATRAITTLSMNLGN
ncbi:hypothetical protein [Tateyamaria sp. SN3-11]|uniref:glycoside hydrolase family 38 N-terminal domain-containing protein n=1 Tax=Tateyamaria sp. SN3-11 TaxID=3092147 RepID=UPI0039EB0D16